MESVSICAVCFVKHGVNREAPGVNVIEIECKSRSYGSIQTVQPGPGNVEQIVRQEESLSGHHHAWYVNETMPLVVDVHTT